MAWEGSTRRAPDPTIRGRGRSGRPWERAKAHIAATRPHICAICGHPIDMKADRHRDPLAFTVHHKVPINAGGAPLDPDNHDPAHRWCNGSAGDKPITPEVRQRCRTHIETLLKGPIERHAW